MQNLKKYLNKTFRLDNMHIESKNNGHYYAVYLFENEKYEEFIFIFINDGKLDVVDRQNDSLSKIVTLYIALHQIDILKIIK